jgi:hypothetical protein
VQALRDMLVQPENLWKKMEEFSVSEICVLQVICVRVGVRLRVRVCGIRVMCRKGERESERASEREREREREREGIFCILVCMHTCILRYAI